MISVQAAAWLAVGLFTVGWLGRRTLLGRAVRETGVIFALYALWQQVLNMTVLHTAGAVGRGRWIIHAEKILHLPSEKSVQEWFLPHRSLISFANWYYAVAHYPDVIAMLVWLFFWHQTRYRWGRWLLIIATGLSLPLQAIPVAPPRLMPGLGVVDTARLLGHPIYSPAGLRDPSQLTAMPSVHCLWASLAAAGFLVVSHSRWRWVVLLHPAITFWAVVVTGNHWWLDGICSLGLLAITLAVLAAPRIVRTWSGGSPPANRMAKVSSSSSRAFPPACP